MALKLLPLLCWRIFNYLNVNKLIVVFCIGLLGCSGIKPVENKESGNTEVYKIPLGGNAWTENGAAITDAGLTDWTDQATVCKVYLRLSRPGALHISLLANALAGKSTLEVSLLGKSQQVTIQGAGEKTYDAGAWEIAEAGYITISIKGLTRTGAQFGLLSALSLSGTATTPDMAYVKNNEGDFFYWGRRGPSVHLNYPTRSLDSIEWFYSQITVPERNDVIGSFFMANGFGEGYFGMQVNSAEERRILFSVWSPYNTDNPDEIPEDQKIKGLQKGEKVYWGEFGNEGSGGQSYLQYPWKAGNTYGFLLRAQPVAGNATVFTAYFYAPEEKKWQLIASFKRPQTQTYLTRLHSFLENFEPETGGITRMAYYHNQWAIDAKGHWTQLNEAKFTGDNTARKGYRKDYAGGLENERFYLKNCGFFDEFTELDHQFNYHKINEKPDLSGMGL